MASGLEVPRRPDNRSTCSRTLHIIFVYISYCANKSYQVLQLLSSAVKT